MKKSSWILLAFAIVVIAALVYMAFFNGGGTPAPEGEPIVIGAILPLTGIAATYGESARDGIQLAVEEINNRGGIDGRLVEVLIENNNTTPKDSVSAFQKLVSVDKVDALIGPLWDFTTQPVLPLAEQQKIALISPINFRLPETLEMNAYTFVGLPSFDDVVQNLETVIHEENIETVGIIRFTSSFADVIASTLDDIMMEKNSSRVIDETYTEFSGNDFNTSVLKMKQQGVGMLFVDALDSGIQNVLENAKKLNLNAVIATHTLGLDLLLNPDIPSDLIEDLVILNYQNVPPAFARRFEERYGRQPRNSPEKSYDMLYVLAEAIANTDSREAVAPYIENHTFKTINGEVSFTEGHYVSEHLVTVDVIKNRELITLYSNQ